VSLPLPLKKLRGFESASELYRSSDRRWSAKLVPTLADRGGKKEKETHRLNCVQQLEGQGAMK
jgi:hypothetical protein